MNTRLAALPCLLALLAATPVAAEVSVDRPASGGVVPHFETSAAGPWTLVRTGLAAGDVLNASGDVSGDGWPQVLQNAGNGRVEAVWSSGGENREIFRAFHDGTSWSVPVNLSSQSGVDQLPAVSSDEHGNLFLAWERERNGRHAVFVTAVSEIDGQVATRELTARSKRGRQPALEVHDELVWVAAQEAATASDGTVQVVLDRVSVTRDSVGRCVDGGEDTIDVARAVSVDTHLGGTGLSAAVQLHSEGGRLWMDWIDEAGVVGWVQRFAPDDWSAPEYEAFGPAEGDAAARAAVREQVLGL